MAVNVKLKKRLQRKNTKDRVAYYWPRAVTAHKSLEAGERVRCLEDAVGNKPKMVRVMREKDYSHLIYYRKALTEYDTFVVLLEDLTE